MKSKAVVRGDLIRRTRARLSQLLCLVKLNLFVKRAIIEYTALREPRYVGGSPGLLISRRGTKKRIGLKAVNQTPETR